VVLGLSGGIGPAVCAAMAADALGPERVHALTLPFRDTPEQALAAATSCARALGIRHDALAITDAVDNFGSATGLLTAKPISDRTERSLRGLGRGLMLKTLSDTLGSMVVATGDKSGLALGLAGAYDAQGGYAPIKDLFTTDVHRLAALRNRWKPAGALGPDGMVIPTEFPAGPEGTDNLPSSAELDAILRALVEGRMRVGEIAALGHDIETVGRIAGMVALAEAARRVSAPGVRLSRTSLGRDRRYPIVNRFRDDGRPVYTPDAAVEGDIGRPPTSAPDF
jgi:NAD+ synthase